MTDLRPRRSVLYMPAANARALEKAKSIPCDAIIFDLEDAVAPDAKETAREQAVAAVASGDYGHRELTIRCNGLDTPWGLADLEAAGSAGPAAVVIPKVGSAAQLDKVASRLSAAGAPDETGIWAMVETPQAIFNAREIAGHDRLTAVVMGTNDLAKELRAQLIPGRAPLLPYLSMTLLACRAMDKIVLDGVCNDLDDADEFQAECLQGFQMGFDGKTLIHPKQVGPCNDVWSPSAAEVEHAQKVIEAFAEAEADGRGVVTVDGRMIENLHVENANRTLAVAAAIAESTQE